MDSNILMRMFFALAIAGMLFVLGCEQAPQQMPETIDIDKDFCQIDTDCVCGGHDADGNCFIGNREYYEAYVDKSEDCPDFCTGIAGNMVLRCVANECIQTYECLTTDDCETGTCQNNKCVGGEPIIEKETPKGSTVCSTDDDCVTDGCSGTVCRHKNAEPVFTTCEYKTEYACYKSDASCGCVGGRCEWKRSSSFNDCVERAR